MTLRDLILPTTDAGVFAQVLLVIVSGACLTWEWRHNPDLRLVGIGTVLVASGLIGVRALH
ncbi:MAG: hypothetical protein OEM39_09660 [Acidimicrobiia bacterium]|nr:hypothetical protein [Acidimicrobiia bacterium]MDH3462888.1 hypothetical protein [Acidimicrobiia bacterium]